MKILSAAVVRKTEAEAVAAGTTTAAKLMELAVAGCEAFLISRHDLPRRALILAGKGNNGNDALLLGSRLRTRGWVVESVLTDPPTRRTRIALEEVRIEEGRGRTWPDRPEIQGKWLIVDGLLGSGAVGPPHGAVADILSWQESYGTTVTRVALDVPSGLEAGRPWLQAAGHAKTPVFQADWTLALGAVKPECLSDAARPWVGRLVGLPLPLTWPEGSEGTGEFILPAGAARLLRPLSSDLHKYRKGEVAIWAGSPGMGGAAVLCSRAALHAGAGVVRLYTHPELVGQLSVATPEIMVQGLDPDKALPASLVQAKTLLIGPGIGRSAGAGILLRRLAEETRAAVVVDADALHLLAAEPSLVDLFSARACVLTPHTGELSVLLGNTVEERAAAAEQWHQAHPRTILVVKGPSTLVMDPRGVLSYNGTGHPGMATAGMGDVLAGVIAALLARGYAPESAARLGVCWHGWAAEKAVQEGSEQTLTAGEVIGALPRAWRDMEMLAVQ